MRLNLGCGTDYRAGYVNCDIDPRVADVVFDLRRPPYPFAEGSVDEIVANNVLEHVGDLPAVMDGLHRILRVGGKLGVTVPHFSSYGAMGHYDHKMAFHYNSFAWCDIEGTKEDMLHDARLWRIRNRMLIFDFWPTWLSRGLLSPLFNAHMNLYTTTGLAYLFPARLLEFIFEKPGPEEEDAARSRLHRRLRVRKEVAGSGRSE